MDFSVSRDVRLLVLILVIIVAHKARGQRELLCSKATDLAIILDSSLDIGNEWQNMLAFSNAMVDAFNIGANKTRVGIITFSQNPELYLGFNDLQGENVTEEAIKGRIATIKHQRNPGRFIDRALRFADKELFVARKGMRVDPDILRVLVVVVGGRQTRNGFPVNLRQVARPLRLKRVDMFAVGVPQLAEIDDEDLIQMASKPENVMTAKTFAESVSLVEEIAKLACGIKILEVCYRVTGCIPCMGITASENPITQCPVT
ncbi:matrilin-4 [Nematostella vectensis]|uniref:matrilin-4 n=1 Tax=Nematostella vectensis TaxID=45351 RepID=UPI001390504A|nr:matrilin-4 [Nematostella vectensis]